MLVCNALAVHAAQPCHRSSLDIPTRGPGRPGSGLRLAGAIYVLTYIYGISTRSSCKKHRPVRWKSGGTKVGLKTSTSSRGCLPNAAAPIEAPSSRGGLATRGSGPHYKPESAAAEPNGNDEFARYVSVTFPGTALGGRRASDAARAVARRGTVTCPGTWPGARFRSV